MNETTDASSILAPLWRRKWLILGVAILVAGATYVYYKRKPTLFSVTTQLYMGSAAEEVIVEKGQGKIRNASATDQAAIINSIVVESVHAQLRKEHNRIAKDAAHAKVRAKASEKSQFITITAEAHLAKSAALIANDTAQAFIKRQDVKHQQAIETAISIAHRAIRRLETPRATTKTHGAASKRSSSAGASGVIAAATLYTKINRLEAQLAIAGAQQIGSAKATRATLLQPKPKKNAIFGFVIGLVLASVAAFALNRFDRRLRSLADIEAVFQMQILSVLPKVKRPIIHEDGQPRPAKALLEPIRRLNATLQSMALGEVAAGNGGPHPPSHRSLLLLSADVADGKSTLTASLALVQRDAGERVTVIDADFRRPALARLLGLTGPQGLAEVLTGTLAVGDAMQSVENGHLPDGSAPEASSSAAVATVAEHHGAGTLSALVSGGPVANPPALLARGKITDLLHSVADGSDSVLIDAPPPLEVSDVLPLLGAVDGIVIVARIGHTRSVSAQRLVQLLARPPCAPVLGVVANAASRRDYTKYGLYAGHKRRSWPGKLVGR